MSAEHLPHGASWDLIKWTVGGLLGFVLLWARWLTGRVQLNEDHIDELEARMTKVVNKNCEKIMAHTDQRIDDVKDLLFIAHPETKAHGNKHED